MPNSDKRKNGRRWILLVVGFIEIGGFYALEASGLFRPKGLVRLAIAMTLAVLNPWFVFPYVRDRAGREP